VLHQLDIKHAFQFGDFVEEVYIEAPPNFIAQGICAILFAGCVKAHTIISKVLEDGPTNLVQFNSFA